MCIIVYKPSGLPVDRETLEICFEHNPDGAGYMFPCEGKTLVKKGFFDFADLWSAWEKTWKIHGDALPVVFHFRIATAGRVDKRNSHPHRIARDLAFVHNGILTCVDVPKNSPISDTVLYRDRHLKTMVGHSLHNRDRLAEIAKHIGKANKFVFLNGKGEVAICNEESGVWDNGLWYSNTTYKPRRYGAWQWRDVCGYCECCGRELWAPEETAEGLCSDCLTYYDEWEDLPPSCAGCDTPLLSASYAWLGWCDDCGYEIYGKDWPHMLREAAQDARKDYVRQRDEF